MAMNSNAGDRRVKKHSSGNLKVAATVSVTKVVVVLIALAVLTVGVRAESTATNEDLAWRNSVEKIVEDYLRNRPEVIEQALVSLETKRMAEEKERVKAAIMTRQDVLLTDPASPVSGNPRADVTVVEFFDYRCGFCKRAAGAVAQLQKDDANIRVVYKDLPILGEESVFAAKAALAAHSQGKHRAFHEALYAATTDLTSAQVMKIASQVGLDTRRLAADMKDPELNTIIQRNQGLAKDLGINGTPAFVVGNELVPGAIEVSAFKEVVARARGGK